ncbi:hypothetical protein [Sporocytophaga sp.]|uniref:hypothetical protein n=1 Tax=Sporocytophaga sp. TaxID=2231183 RepID=UPI0026005116|nr:hypothetical protein [Sporocytophaga sp.]
MRIYIPNIILLLLCLISRILTSLYYVEDVENLHYALNVMDFDWALSQADYAGAPLFVAITKVTYLITGNMPVAFSVIGAFGLFLLIYFTLNVLQVPLVSLEGSLTALLIFFSQAIWLASNRYLPDVLAVAGLMACFYYLVPDHYQIKQVYKGCFAAGLVLGIKLGYFPFLIVPLVYAFISNNKFIPCLGYFIIGVLLWLMPVIIATGWTDFINLSTDYTKNYFIFGLTNFKVTQIFSFVEHLWRDGLGGFWIDSSPFTLIISVGILFCTFFGIIILLSFDYPKAKNYVISGTLGLYGIWAIIFPNQYHGSVDVLPLIPFFLITISYGIIYFIVNYNYLSAKLMVLVFLFTNISITVYLVVQHMNPTALAQAKMYVDEIEDGKNDSLNLISVQSINYYLEAQKVKGKFYSVELDKEKIGRLKMGKVITIGEGPFLLKRNPKKVTAFHHNPEVNRNWADIWVYEY